jgi:hypothetical protein
MIPVSLLAAATLLLTLMLYQRRRTRAKLEGCGLPTVYWRPRLSLFTGTSSSASWIECPIASFVRSKGVIAAADDGGVEAADNSELRVLRSSNITNILPRMKRLKGPYGMYGTVYGINVAAVHVAHPIPAAAILGLHLAGTKTKAAMETDRIGKSRSRVNSQATKAPAYDHFKSFCGDGVFTADGDDWKRKRAAVLHVLLRNSGSSSCSSDQNTDGNQAQRRGSLSSSFETKVECNAQLAAHELTERLDQLLGPSVSSEGDSARRAATINVVPLLQWATIGLIYRYLTHCDLPLDDPIGDGSVGRSVPEVACRGFVNTSFSQATPIASLRVLLPQYLQSITRIRMIILAQSRSIWFLLPNWCYRRFSSLFREEERTMGPIRAFSTLACLHARPGSPLHALSHNFAPYNCERNDPRERDSLPLPPFVYTSTTNVSKHLLDEAITLLFAGQDTSAATLSWTLHLLSLYPAVQTKLAEEVLSRLEVMGADQRDQPLTRKALACMPYLDAVVKESMRLYPVAPFIVRRLPFDLSIPPTKETDPDGRDSPPRLVLPKDSLACIWIYSLHRHEDFWKDPNDFRPERWLEAKASHRDPGISNGAYMPFAAGPRNCVGQPLAQIVLRSLLAQLISRFEFRDARLRGSYPATIEIADGLRKDMQAGFTVLPEGGVDLWVTRRMDAVTDSSF